VIFEDPETPLTKVGGLCFLVTAAFIEGSFHVPTTLLVGTSCSRASVLLPLGTEAYAVSRRTKYHRTGTRRICLFAKVNAHLAFTAACISGLAGGVYLHFAEVDRRPREPRQLAGEYGSSEYAEESIDAGELPGERFFGIDTDAV
jgi:hypothetical protein